MSASDEQLFAVNPDLDRDALAAEFKTNRRIQIRNVLSDAAARNLHAVLARQTPWGLAWSAGADGPHGLRREEMARLSPQDRATIGERLGRAMQGQDYAFSFARYPLLDAYVGGWAPGGPHDLVMEHINDQPLMDLVRTVTGVLALRKADAQATLFGPGHFLSVHSDSHKDEGWHIAYVLSLCLEEWRPDWGGYLMFYDEDGDVVAGYRPRFNALNLFAVPQAHAVTYVPPFAPVGRFSITGWFRDR